MISSRGVAWAASLAAILFGGFVLVSGIDRYTAHLPSAVRFIPGSMQVESARSQAIAALALGDYNVARSHAATAIRRDPLDVRGAAFFAAALQLSGKPEMAKRAFAQAASLGWREPLTQIHGFNRAIEVGNFEGAAIRLDAMLRAHPDFAPTQGYLDMLESTPGGRRALLERLRNDPRWAELYLSAFEAEDETLRARARFIAIGAQRGLAFGCERSLPMVRELAQRNYRAEAEALLETQCPSADETLLLVDAGFEQFGDDSATGLGWRKHVSGDMRITLVGDENRGLELANRSSVTRPILSQAVALEPGAYLLRGEFAAGNSGRLLASLDCGKLSRPAESVGRIGAEGAEVIARQCPNQVISLWLRPGEGSITLNALALSPR